jgi:hypothetical protein
MEDKHGSQAAEQRAHGNSISLNDLRLWLHLHCI